MYSLDLYKSVIRMTSFGISLRNIEMVTGVSKSTVHRWKHLNEIQIFDNYFMFFLQSFPLGLILIISCFLYRFRRTLMKKRLLIILII